MTILYPTLFTLSGALIYRWRGMDNNWHPLPQILFALLYPIVSFLHHAPLSVSIIMFIIIWLFTALTVLTGHGGFMDLGHSTKPRKDERIEFLIKWLKPHMSEYWYDFIGLSLTGLLITLPAGIVTLNPILALSGLLKGPAYAIGWLLNKGDGDRAVEAGEVITGAFLYLVLGIFLIY